MGVVQIENPADAFSSAGQDSGPTLTRVVMTLPVGTTVLAHQVVILNYNAATNQYTIAPAAAASATQAIGIAIEAGNVGAVVRVVTHGTTTATAGATLATGAIASVGAPGALAASSATIGCNIGFAVVSMASGATGQFFVSKM